MTATFVIFDLDGTISDPSLGIGRCLNHARVHHGYAPIEEGKVSRFVGPPLDETFRSIVGNPSPEHIAALVAKYRERYAAVGYSENVIYPGIREALRELRDAGISLGLCTSKRADFAEAILDLFGMRAYFGFVDGGDIGIRKADQLAGLVRGGVSAKSSTMIGDRAVDIAAAKANGLKSIAVLWGHGGLEELRGVSPDAVAEHPLQLSRLLRLSGACGVGLSE